jgi:hypothetical protein
MTFLGGYLRGGTNIAGIWLSVAKGTRKFSLLFSSEFASSSSVFRLLLGVTEGILSMPGAAKAGMFSLHCFP